MNKIMAAAGLAASALLSGCSLNQPTPDMHYHLLDSQNRSINAKLPAEQVAIDKVHLADYLRQANLVMRVAQNKLDVARYHNWAEPLDDSIRRVLLAELNSINANLGFVARCQNCQQFDLYIEHFYPDEQGQVTLSGYFVTSQGDAKRQTEYFSLTAQQSSAGYSASVEVMNQLLIKLAHKLNASLPSQ